jgi:hypothetical protein
VKLLDASAPAPATEPAAEKTETASAPDELTLEAD